MARPPTHGALEVASRTDRGVSARANALGLTSDLAGPALLRALNGIDPSLWFTALRSVPEGFPVRRAVRRVYRYFEPPDQRSHEASRAAARLFLGEVDVGSFGRGLPRSGPVLRTLESVEIATEPDGGRTIEVRAPGFVWGEVRKIVAALREVDAGRLTERQLRQSLAGDVRLTLPMAEPEALVLWEVEYADPWVHFWTGPNRRQAARVAEERGRWWGRSRWLGEFGGGAD